MFFSQLRLVQQKGSICDSRPLCPGRCLASMKKSVWPVAIQLKAIDALSRPVAGTAAYEKLPCPNSSQDLRAETSS